MESVRTEGIVIHIVRYRDYDQIASVFTRDHGMIKLIVKSGLATAGKGGTAVTALTRAEFVYSIGRGDIYRCHEVSSIDGYLELRKTYKHLTAACKMLEAVKSSQVGGDRPAHQLYDLLVTYLNRLPELDEPDTAAASFQLKTLRHEGLWGGAEDVSADSALMDRLAFCRTFAELKEIFVTDEFVKKIDRIFVESIR